MAPIILDDSELMLPPSFRRRRYHRDTTTTIEAAPSYHSSSMPHPYSRRDLDYQREYEPEPITPPRSPVILHEDRIHKETIIPRDALPPGVAIVSRDEIIGRRGKSEKSYYREGGSRSEIGSVRDERMSIRDDREREYTMSGAYRDPPSEIDYERERPIDYRDVPTHPDGDRVYLDYRHNREEEEPHRVIESGVGTRHHRLSGNYVSEEEHHHRRRALAEAAGGLGAGAGGLARTVRRGRGERREYRDGYDSRGSSRSTSSSPDRHRGRKIAAGVVGAGAALGLAAAAAHHMRNKSRDGLVYSSDELDDEGRIIRRGRRGTRSDSRPRSHSRAKKLVAATALGAGIAAARHRRRSRSRASSVSGSDAGSRSGSRHRGRKIAAAAAATSAGIAGVNYIRRRSKSRGHGTRSSSTSSLTSSDDERHPSHKGRKLAAAALGAAAAGAALKHHQKKEEEREDLQRGRSRSRSHDRGPKGILRKVRSLSMGGKPRRRSGSVSSYTSDSSYTSNDSRRSRRSHRARHRRPSTVAQIGKGIAVGVAAKALQNAFENHERRKYEYDSDDSRSSRRSHHSRRSRPGMGRRVRSRSLGGHGRTSGWAGKLATGVATSALGHILDSNDKGGRRRR